MTQLPLSKSIVIKHMIGRYIFLTLGAFIAGFGLEGFLVPNNIIDGGVVGISMMLSYIFKINLGILIFVINLPFLFLAYKKMGKRFVIQTLYSISMLAIAVNIFHHHNATNDLLLATVFGGIVLGTGVGLILRNDGSLDGTEIISMRLAKKMGFSVGEFIMFFNLFIYCGAGFLFGWDKAMYSILTYFIAYRVIDVVMEGLNGSKSITIVSDDSKEIGDAIIEKLDVSVTYIKGRGGYSGMDKTLIYCVISRLELSKLKELVKSIDPTAFLAVEDVHEVEGKRFKKK